MSKKTRYPACGHRLPRLLSIPLFGDRKRYGLRPVPGDTCWQSWLADYTKVMQKNKGFVVSDLVYNSSYRHVADLDTADKRLVEIGPGDMNHLKHLSFPPARIELVDVDQSMLDMAQRSAQSVGIPCNTHRISPSDTPVLPFASNSVDVVFSFFVFEHVLPLKQLLKETKRILKPGGKLLGSIPCEGGIAWGLGRFLTTRRHYRKNSYINFDKIICWEHPNFADHILANLMDVFPPEWIDLWPFGTRLIDINLTASFVCRKKNAPKRSNACLD